MIKGKEIYLPDIVGKGYGTFWRCQKRYRVVKGSRASKKSKTIALNYIHNLMKYPEANLLVVRRHFRTLKDSCYSDLVWATHRLKVADKWKATVNPMEITYIPTGQKILFRGLDDSMKITSISVPNGVLCWIWLEEAYQLESEEAFDTLDESIRGEVPPGLFKQATLSFNPWNERHWLKKKFFDPERDDTLAVTTNYMCNEWLDATDLKMFENMKKFNPRRYEVAGLGNWGITDGLVFENWEERSFSWSEELQHRKKARAEFGLDFGYTNDPTAFWCGIIDPEAREILVFDELYEKRMSNEKIAEVIKEMGFRKEEITADCAEPKSIDQLKGLGLRRIKGARKGKDSVMNGIQYIQGYKIVVHPKCTNFLCEIGNYSWKKDKQGVSLNEPVDAFNHLMDAMRYALEKYTGKQKKLGTLSKASLGVR